MRSMRSIRTVVLLTAATALVASAVAAPSLASAAPTKASVAGARSGVAPLVAASGYFTPLARPVRILDTRKTNPFASGQTSPLYVGGPSGKAGLPPSGVSSAVFNLTVTGGTASTDYVTAFPTGTTRPTASSINFKKGWTGANLVTVRLGTNGEVSFYNNAGHVHLIVDVVGWYSSGAASAQGEFQEAQPQRLVDTNDPGIGAVEPHGTLTLPLDYSGDMSAGNHHTETPNPQINAMAINLTAVNPTGAGYLTAWSGSAPVPTTSVLNFASGRTTTNLAVVPTRACPVAVCSDPDTTSLPSITIYNGSSVRVHILIDAWGFYDKGGLTPSGLVYKALTSPIRIVDTRPPLSQGTTTLGTATTRTVTAPGTVADASTQLLVQNVTAVPQTNTYVTLWRAGTSRPGVSNLDPLAGRTVATLAYTGVGTTNNFSIYNNSNTTNVIIDVAGSFELGPGHAAVAPMAQQRGQASGLWTARSAGAVTR
jgi:hypothetical protein